jgi:hypothetical protein
MTSTLRRLSTLPDELDAMRSPVKAALRVKLLTYEAQEISRAMVKSLAEYGELDRRHRETCRKLERAREFVRGGVT